MSVRMMAKVWELDLPLHLKILALALADHADDDGRHIFPSQNRLAWKIGSSPRTIKRHLRALEETGILEVVRRGSGRGITNLYALHPDKGPRLMDFDPLVFDPPPGLRNRLLLETDPICHYCNRQGDALDPDGKPWQMDRRVPGHRGGRYEWENVVRSCVYCNQSKGANLALFPEETLDSQEKVPPRAKKGATAMAPDPSGSINRTAFESSEAEFPREPGETRQAYVTRLLAEMKKLDT